MKNILLLVHDDSGQEARLQVALDVTRAVKGHLYCVDVVALPPVVGDLYSGVGTAMLIADEREREAGNARRIQARLAQEDVPWSWSDASGGFAPCLKDAAALADLVVINCHLDDFPVPDMRATAGELLVRADKPVLAVPAAARGFAANGRALVAWDGSPAAQAALQAAVPLLSLAASVELFEVHDGSTRTPAEEAASYVSRYGIHPVINRSYILDEQAGAMILRAIRNGEHDYVVMGGFGHARWSEALFGGVTRTLLTHCPVPLFLAH